MVAAVVNIIAAIAVHQLTPILTNIIVKKFEEEYKLYVYRWGNPNSMKPCALIREDDWKSGLSFSYIRPTDRKSLRFNVKKLLMAGFAVFADEGRPVTNILDGSVFREHPFPAGHASVFIPDRQIWDEWYNAEKGNKSENPFVPNHPLTALLYSLQEREMP